MKIDISNTNREKIDELHTKNAIQKALLDPVFALQNPKVMEYAMQHPELLLYRTLIKGEELSEYLEYIKQHPEIVENSVLEKYAKFLNCAIQTQQNNAIDTDVMITPISTNGKKSSAREIIENVAILGAAGAIFALDAVILYKMVYFTLHRTELNIQHALQDPEYALRHPDVIENAMQHPELLQGLDIIPSSELSEYLVQHPEVIKHSEFMKYTEFLQHANANLTSNLKPLRFLAVENMKKGGNICDTYNSIDTNPSCTFRWVYTGKSHVPIRDCSAHDAGIQHIRDTSNHILVYNTKAPINAPVFDPTSITALDSLKDIPIETTEFGYSYSMTSYELYEKLGNNAVAALCDGTVTHAVGDAFLTILPFIAILAATQIMAKRDINKAFQECGCPTEKSPDRPSSTLVSQETLWYNA